MGRRQTDQMFKSQHLKTTETPHLKVFQIMGSYGDFFFFQNKLSTVVVVVLLFYVHGKQLWSSRDG